MLNIIRLFMNPIDMSFTMPAESKNDLINAIFEFIDTTSLCWYPLVEWQRLLGWINWGLNTFPLLNPRLHSSYTKIWGKSNAHASIFLNKQVLMEPPLVAETMESAMGLLLFNATEWSPSEADMVMYCDVSLMGLSFYCPTLNFAYYADITTSLQPAWSFFYKALCAISTNVGTWLDLFTTSTLIYMDSMNTIEMFNSLKAQQGYKLLMHAMVCSSHPLYLGGFPHHRHQKHHCWCPLVRITQCSSVPSPWTNSSAFLAPTMCSGADILWALHALSPGNQFTLPGPMSTYSANMLLPLVMILNTWHPSHTLCTYNCTSHFENFITTPPTNNQHTLHSTWVFMCHHINPCLVNAYLSGICNTLEPHFPDVLKTLPRPACHPHCQEWVFQPGLNCK